MKNKKIYCLLISVILYFLCPVRSQITSKRAAITVIFNSTSWTVKWYLRELPTTVGIAVGSESLVIFVKKIIKKYK